jgi:nitrogen fixation protein NifT
MLRRTKSDALSFYVAKQDLEAEVKRVEFSGPGKWGGEIELDDGSRYFIQPLDREPRLPITVRASRVRED